MSWGEDPDWQHWFYISHIQYLQYLLNHPKNALRCRIQSAENIGKTEFLKKKIAVTIKYQIKTMQIEICKLFKFILKVIFFKVICLTQFSKLMTRGIQMFGPFSFPGKFVTVLLPKYTPCGQDLFVTGQELFVGMLFLTENRCIWAALNLFRFKCYCCRNFFIIKCLKAFPKTFKK